MLGIEDFLAYLQGLQMELFSACEVSLAIVKGSQVSV